MSISKKGSSSSIFRNRLEYYFKNILNLFNKLKECIVLLYKSIKKNLKEIEYISLNKEINLKFIRINDNEGKLIRKISLESLLSLYYSKIPSEEIFGKDTIERIKK